GWVLLRVRGQVWFCCRSTAPVRTANEAGTDQRPGQAPFAPGAGAPTVRGRFRFCCRSTAPGANRERGGHRFAPRAGPIRTRGGCSYGFEGRFWFFAVGAPPRCEPRTRRAQICVLGRPHSHPGRVLL